MKKNIIKTIGSLIFIALALLISVLVIKTSGVWHRDNVLLKFFITIIVGFGVNSGLVYYLKNKKTIKINELISFSIVGKLYIAVATLFFLLGVFTGLLMLRNGTYVSGEFLRVTMIYFTVTAYFVVGVFVVKKFRF